METRNLRKTASQVRSSIWILHPFFFFLYSILSLMATNQSLPLQAAVRSLIIGFFVIGLTLFAATRLWDGERAALIASGIIILFFSYGHLVNLIEIYLGKPIEGSLELVLLVPGLFALGLWFYFVKNRLRNPINFSTYFLVVSLLVNISPLLQRSVTARHEGIAQQQFQAYQEELSQDLELRTGDEVFAAGELKRDIYYIILDAYARADVLHDLYAYDNSAFIQSLEQRGFYVATESHANYIATELSLASSLNMSHIDDLPEFLESKGGIDENSVKSVAVNLIRSNILQDYLHGSGYTIVSIESGYSTAMGEADVYLKLPDVDRGSALRVGFESMLLDSSIGRLIMRIFPQSANMLDWMFDLHRERILYAFDHIGDFAEDSRPTLVYAHIISPHTPYVFGPNGERIEHKDPFTLLDAHPGNPENINFYRDQVNYLNYLVLDVIDEILETSTSDPIIILQADHGSKVYSQSQVSPEIQCRLHLPILNAYYFPGHASQNGLYKSISPVNSFRILLNQYFQEDLKLLPDRSFKLVEMDGKLGFEDYQNAVGACQ